MRVVATVVGWALAMAYPFAIYFALTHWSARSVGLLGLAIAVPLFALRFRNADRAHLFAVLRIPLLVLVLLTLGALFDDQRFVLAMPVLINLGLLVTFAGSLRGEMPIVERFARMKERELNDAQKRHCRQTTVAWCIFFVLNGTAAAVLALMELREAWAIYTGGIAYGLMGAMFAGEHVIRHVRFRNLHRHAEER
jgi:uncharacterized membrane protein